MDDQPDQPMHYVVRDGSFWTCVHCKRQWPYPSPLPRDAGPCNPRPWLVTE
jgi:hypothetical protein